MKMSNVQTGANEKINLSNASLFEKTPKLEAIKIWPIYR